MMPKNSIKKNLRMARVKNAPKKPTPVDHRLLLFKRHLEATKGFSDARLKEYLFNLPLEDLRMIKEMFKHYPRKPGNKLLILASRADEIYALRHNYDLRPSP